MTNTYYHNGKRKKKKVRYRKKRVAMLVAGFIGICSAITLSMTDCSSYSHQEPEKEEIPSIAITAVIMPPRMSTSHPHVLIFSLNPKRLV